MRACGDDILSPMHVEIFCTFLFSFADINSGEEKHSFLVTVRSSRADVNVIKLCRED